jgi:hypothetical protein
MNPMLALSRALSTETDVIAMDKPSMADAVAWR